MNAQQHLTCVAAVLLLGACRNSEETVATEDLPPVAEIELVTPTEAAEIAAVEITEANVDEAYAELLKELGEDER
jgi:hypothetical protein